MYYLKQYDDILLAFDMKYDDNGLNISNIQLKDHPELLPLDLTVTPEGLTHWLKQRSIPKNREYVDKFLSKCGLNHNDIKGLIDISKGLSLNDSYWITSDDLKKTFNECNLYEHNFSQILALIAFTGYGTSVRSTFISSPEFTTTGQLAKCWRRINGQVILYKTGTTGYANAGLEPYSEYYASQIARVMQCDAVKYNLSQWKGHLCSTCNLFTDKDHAYMPMGYLVKTGGFISVVNYLKDLGDDYYNAFLDMLVFDAIIMNTDRHYGNFGLIIDNKTNNPIKFAPIFDNGAGLLPYAMDNDEFLNIDTLQAYVKTRTPVMYNDFIAVAKKYMTSKQYEKVKHLVNFKFKKHARYNLNDNRLKLLEKIIQMRVEELLK